MLKVSITWIRIDHDTNKKNLTRNDDKNVWTDLIHDGGQSQEKSIWSNDLLDRNSHTLGSFVYSDYSEPQLNHRRRSRRWSWSPVWTSNQCDKKSVVCQAIWKLVMKFFHASRPKKPWEVNVVDRGKRNMITFFSWIVMQIEITVFWLSLNLLKVKFRWDV